MYDEQGEKTWDCTLDVYGKVANFEGSSLKECPFRYQGQYEDRETGLYYNRFRYYSVEEGMYISQDPIRLLGGNNLYAYANDTNSWIDIFGLRTCQELDAMSVEAHSKIKDRRTKNSSTTAVGEDKDGNLYVSSSRKYVPKETREWAKENNAKVVSSRKKGVHAEEAVYNGATSKPVAMGSSRPICPDCQEGMTRNNVDYNKQNTTKKRSKSREGTDSKGEWSSRA